jgi:DNA-directed RNA polymerase subunit K/omega
MPKKISKQKIKKEESDSEEENIEDEENDIEDEETYSETNDDIEDTGCIIEKTIEEDNEYFANLIDSEINIDSTEEIITDKDDRVSMNRMTKYELVRILGERIKQLTMGAKPMVKNFQNLSYELIAIEEVKLNMCPFKIKRCLPNGKIEIWELFELEKEHLAYLFED